MSYKIKSFLYFVCFVVSAVLYYALEPNNDNKAYSESAEIIKLHTNSIDNDNRLAERAEILE